MSPRTPQRIWRQVAVAAVAVAAIALTATATSCLSPTDSDAPTTDAPDAAALTHLGELKVAKAGSMRGYSRDRFSHWRSAGKNCDVRDSVLRREGENVKLSGCNVTGGRWFSVYDGETVKDPALVDIDHMVPLANAWRSGADRWDDERRSDFANDLTRPQLLAVSRSTNRSKGDQDPSQWKPPSRDGWCAYAEDWIAVKHYWQLTVTADEKAALNDMLETCEWTSKKQ